MFDFFYKRSRNSRIFATMLRFLYGCDIPPHTKIGGGYGSTIEAWEL